LTGFNAVDVKDKNSESKVRRTGDRMEEVFARRTEE
jgi:hypothetical protein